MIETPPKTETIHQRIKRLRLMRKMSHADLAKKAGTTWQSVQQWENEKRPSAPSRKRLAIVAAALGVSEQELITGRKAETPATDVSELLALWDWLTDHQKREHIAAIRSTAEANKAIANQLKGKLSPVPDERVDAAYNHHKKERK